MALVAQVADEGDALLQVHLQGQQARVPLMSPQHRCMHPLHLPAPHPHSRYVAGTGLTALLVCESTCLQRLIAQGMDPPTLYTFLHSSKVMHLQLVLRAVECDLCLLL